MLIGYEKNDQKKRSFQLVILSKTLVFLKMKERIKSSTYPNEITHSYAILPKAYDDTMQRCKMPSYPYNGAMQRCKTSSYPYDNTIHRCKMLSKAYDGTMHRCKTLLYSYDGIMQRCAVSSYPFDTIHYYYILSANNIRLNTNH